MTHYQLVSDNKRKSALIVFFFIIFITGASYLMATAFEYDLSLVGMALIFSGLTSFFGYWWSDKIILTISKAKPANRGEHFDYYTTVENICLEQRLPIPKLYVIEDTAMNAFATGRDAKHAVVCVTSGLLARLKRSEIEGVVAHELSHIKNYDMLLMSIVTVLVGVVSLLSDWMLRASWGNSRNRKSKDSGQIQIIILITGFVLALLSPLIAQLIKLAISRRREFSADATGVAMTKNPEGLARALEIISQDKEPLEVANKATAHLYIADPLKNQLTGIKMFANLFQTHPPIQDRINNLRKIA